MNRVAGRYLWGNERLEIKGLDSIRHTFLLLAIEQTSVLSERHWYYTQVTHCFLCHFEVSLPLQGVEMRVSLCGRVKSVSIWVCVGTGFLGLVPFPLQIYKHPVFLVAKRILGIRAVPTIESKVLGANLQIQGRVRLMLCWWSTCHRLHLTDMAERGGQKGNLYSLQSKEKHQPMEGFNCAPPPTMLYWQIIIKCKCSQIKHCQQSLSLFLLGIEIPSVW